MNKTTTESTQNDLDFFIKFSKHIHIDDYAIITFLGYLGQHDTNRTTSIGPVLPWVAKASRLLDINKIVVFLQKQLPYCK